MEWQRETDFPNGQEGVNALAIANDGKIVVAGWRRVYRRFRLALARYTSDGNLDPSFGEGGTVSTDVPNSPTEGRVDGGVNAVVIAPDNTIIVGGWATFDSSNRFLLARYTEDGSLDTNFGSDRTGIVITDFATSTNEFATDVAIAPDGTIIAAGLANRADSWHFALARYESDGGLDPTLNGNGTLITLFSRSTNEGANAVAIKNNTIVLAGWAVIQDGSIRNHHCQFMLVGYTWNGTRDNSFGEQGIVLTDFDTSLVEWISDIIISDDDKIIAGGSALHGARDGRSDDNHRFALARYNWDGTPDADFVGAGRVLSRLMTGNEEEWANAIAITRGGGFLVAGSAYTQGNYQFTVGAYSRRGFLVGSFGEQGRLRSSLATTGEWAGSVVASGNNGFVVAGEGGNFSNVPVRSSIIDLQVPWSTDAVPGATWITYCRWDQFMTPGGWRANGHGVGLWGGVDYFIGCNEAVRAAQRGAAENRGSFVEITNDRTGIGTRYRHVTPSGSFPREVNIGDLIGHVNSKSGHVMFEVQKNIDGQWRRQDIRDVHFNGQSPVPSPFEERLNDDRFQLKGLFQSAQCLETPARISSLERRIRSLQDRLPNAGAAKPGIVRRIKELNGQLESAKRFLRRCDPPMPDSCPAPG